MNFKCYSVIVSALGWNEIECEVKYFLKNSLTFWNYVNVFLLFIACDVVSVFKTHASKGIFIVFILFLLICL